jgi:hypothetical protein
VLFQLVLMPYVLRRVSGLILAAVVRMGDEYRDSYGVAIEVSEGRGNHGVRRRLREFPAPQVLTGESELKQTRSKCRVEGGSASPLLDAMAIR